MKMFHSCKNKWMGTTVERTREQEKECPDFCSIFVSAYPLRPNIWGGLTDGPLFASHHSNVLPAPAPMSINGRHVPKHIQHTKRTLWLEEMDCAQDWQGTLWMCQSPKALCFTSVSSFKNKDFCFCFICLCVQYNTWNSCLTFGCRRKSFFFQDEKAQT